MKYDLGIIGGGQLGMMMIQEAKKLNLTSIVLDPNEHCSCSHFADKVIVGSFNDIEKLSLLASSCKVLSYEFENVKGEILAKLDSQYHIPQGIRPLLDSQDRLVEKDNAKRFNLKTIKYHDCSSYEDLAKALKELSLPLIYKSRREGYDGHGQERINTLDDVKKIYPYLDKKIAGILEEKIDFDCECSIIMIRDKKTIINFPISKNIHKDSILDISSTPSNLPTSLEQ